MPKTLETLRSLRVRAIDLENARCHFDLPIEDQFQSRRDLVSGLASTKDHLIALFKSSDSIPIWRGMDCDKEWADAVQPGDDLGCSWAWQLDGALKGSGLDREGSTGVVLMAIVDESDIDWELTVAVNTFHEAEYEIVLRDGCSADLKTITEWPSKALLLDWSDGPPSGMTI
jgi:hypothetical protein